MSSAAVFRVRTTVEATGETHGPRFQRRCERPEDDDDENQNDHADGDDAHRLMLPSTLMASPGGFDGESPGVFQTAKL